MNPRKEFIKEIYKTNFEFRNIDQSMIQSNLLDTVSKDLYPDPKRFIIEILQNCDDSSFMYNEGNFTLNLTINLFKQSMIISHKGKPFSQDDIKSICSAGNSTKIMDEKCTGYKGIGFKSVFEHSSKVIIISNEYQFRFDKNYFSNEKNWQNEWGSYEDYIKEKQEKKLVSDIKKPWQIIPIWTEKEEISEKNLWNITRDFNVNFIVYFNSIDSFKICKSYLYEIEKDYHYLLFLKSKYIIFTLLEDNVIVRNMTKNENKIDENSNYLQILSDSKIIENFIFKSFKVNIRNEISQLNLIKEDIPEKLKIVQAIVICFAMPFHKINNRCELKTVKDENRLLFAFLPTKVNYNFPFLINTNFLLDASRTQLIEGSWNKMIFSLLPQYILEFQNFIFKIPEFQNSFANCLLFDLKISCKQFENSFFSKFIKQNIEDICIYTKSGDRKKFTECYFNKFSFLSADNIKCESISNFFKLIYSNDEKKILISYFQDKGIKYYPEFEIDENDLAYIENIKKYYNIDYYVITMDEIFNFLDSNHYKKNFSFNSFYILLKKIRDKRYLSKIKTFSIVPDKNMIFYKPEEFIIYQPNEDPFVNQILDRLTEEIYRASSKGKKEIHPKIIEKLTETDDELSLLDDIGVCRINESNTENKLLVDLEKYYNETTSVSIIKILFLKWTKTDDKKNKEDIIKNIKNKAPYLLNVKGEFLTLQSLNINPFYNNDNKFQKYEDNFITSDYYIQSTKKEDWVKFFVELECWQKENYQNCFLLELNLERFTQIPYILNQYKEIIKFKKNQNRQFYVLPELNHIYDENIYQIKNFFENNINYITSNNDPRIKKDKFLNYFEWFIVKHKNLMVSNHLELKPIDTLYSYTILNDKTPELKKFLLNNLNFCCSEKIDNYLGFVTKLKDNLDKDTIRSLLDKIVIHVSKLESNKEKTSFKNYFMKELCELATFKKPLTGKNKGKSRTKIIKVENNNSNSGDIVYKGWFLNIDDEFKKAEELFLFRDEIMKDLLANKLKKNKFFELKTPPEEENKENFSQFIEFAKNNGVRIYIRENITYLTEGVQIDIDLENKVRNIKPHLINLLKKFGHTDIDKIEKQFENIKFFNCSKIFINTSFNDTIEYGISYYKKNLKEFNIFFLIDEVYTSWKHPTIIYFVSKFLTKHLDCEFISKEIQMLFLLEKDKDIENWLENIF